MSKLMTLSHVNEATKLKWVTTAVRANQEYHVRVEVVGNEFFVSKNEKKTCITARTVH